MSEYTTIAGDTFANISRKVYGTELNELLISTANPGASEPFNAGTSLTIPIDPNAPKNSAPFDQSDNPDEVSVFIQGKRFRFWDSVSITQAIDSFSTIQLTAPFDSEGEGFKAAFRPFRFDRIEVNVGGTPLFTGVIVAMSPELTNDGKQIAISGYSIPGVLMDCMPPASQAPLEFRDQGLYDIASTLCAPFGISVQFDSDQGSIFRNPVALAPGQKIFSFLRKLAGQRNLVMSNTPLGSLLFQQSTDSGSPVATLFQGVSPVQSVLPAFRAQEYYSHITGVEPALFGLEGARFTSKNTKLPGVVRPYSFDAVDTEEGAIETAVNAKMGRMFANAASYRLQVNTWRDPSGKLWKPNALLSLDAPGAMVYAPYIFVIRSVSMSRDSNNLGAALNLIMPGSMSGKIPEVLPWEA